MCWRLRGAVTPGEGGGGAEGKMGAGDRGALRGRKGTGGAERRQEPVKGQGKKGGRMCEGRNRGGPGCAVCL